MELNYVVHEADNLLFQRDFIVNSRSEVVKKRVRNFAMAVYAIILVINLIVAAAIREPKFFIIVTIVIAVEAIIWTILVITKKAGYVVWFLGKRAVKKTVHNYYVEKSLVGNGEPVQMILDDTEMYIKNNNAETKINWQAVLQIVMLDGIICIYTSGVTAQLIPTKQLPAQTYDELVKYLSDVADNYGIKLIKNSK